MKNKLLFFLPILVSLILHFHVLDLDIVGFHSWRQTQTQTVIYNFSHSDNNILHPQRFDLTLGDPSIRYEFPLYQWIIAQADGIFGYSIRVTRIMTFLFFALFLWGSYKLLRIFVERKVALITHALLCFSPLLYYYCVNPLPDILALAFSIWALYFFYRQLSSQKLLHFILFCVFISLATLVKLPYVLFSSVLLLYFIRLLRAKKTTALALQLFLFLIFLLPAITWYVKVIPSWKGNPIVEGMTSNEKSFSILADYFVFSLTSSVPELLTNFAACIPLFFGIFLFIKNFRSLHSNIHYLTFVFIAFSFYYLFEMNLIEKTHDYYLMPFVPLIFLVVAFGTKKLLEGKFKVLLYLFLIIAPITAFFRIDQRWDENSPGYNTDLLTKQVKFQQLIPEGEIVVVDHDRSRFITLYFLKRQGYSLEENEMNAEVLRKYYDKGARYLLTENLSLDLNAYHSFSFKELYSGKLKIYQLNLTK
jgi:hypothetical protein